MKEQSSCRKALAAPFRALTLLTCVVIFCAAPAAAQVMRGGASAAADGNASVRAATPHPAAPPVAQPAPPAAGHP